MKLEVSSDLIGLHFWDDAPGLFLVGRVSEVEGDRFLFEEVGTRGQVEAKEWRSFTDIVGVDTKSEYLNFIGICEEIEAWKRDFEGKRIRGRRMELALSGSVGRVVMLKKARERSAIPIIVDSVENGWVYFKNIEFAREKSGLKVEILSWVMVDGGEVDAMNLLLERDGFS